MSKILNNSRKAIAQEWNFYIFLSFQHCFCAITFLFMIKFHFHFKSLSVKLEARGKHYSAVSCVNFSRGPSLVTWIIRTQIHITWAHFNSRLMIIVIDIKILWNNFLFSSNQIRYYSFHSVFGVSVHVFYKNFLYCAATFLSLSLTLLSLNLWFFAFFVPLH